LILGTSQLATRVEPLRFNLELLVFLRSKCLFPAWNLLTFPEPVTLNLFFALECVFILGIILNYFRGAKVQ